MTKQFQYKVLKQNKAYCFAQTNTIDFIYFYFYFFLSAIH